MPKPTFFHLPADKRQRIVDAAVEEFGARPYAKATLDRIVEDAGVSKGSMYQYFSGKSDLYVWLLTAYMADRKLAYIGAMAPPEGATAWEVLERAFLAGVRFAAAEPQLTRLASRFLRDHQQEPELAEVSARNQAAGRAWMTDLLTRAQARGELRADLDVGMVTTVLLHALGEGMLEHLAHRLGLSVPEFYAQPEATQSLSDADLHEIVQGVTRLFREGAAPSPSKVAP